MEQNQQVKFSLYHLIQTNNHFMIIYYYENQSH
jgi:hypothetical protein